MYIDDIGPELRFLLSNPTNAFKPLLTAQIRNNIGGFGNVSRDRLKTATRVIQSNLLFSLFLVFIIPIICLVFIVMLNEAFLPDSITIHNPGSILLLIVYCGLLISAVLVGWLIFNNRIGYCIYLHMLGTIFYKFYYNYSKIEDRDVYLSLCLKQLSKEWDYYDQSGKL